MLVFALAGLVLAGGAWYAFGDSPAPTSPGMDDCAQLLEDYRRYGRAGGDAIFVRRIQHTAGDTGFRSSGWLGAVMGAFTGLGDGSSRLAAAKAACGAALDEAAAQHRADRQGRHEAKKAIRDEFQACKDACKAAHPEARWPFLGPNSKPYRDCVQACRQTRHDDRRGLRGERHSAVGEFFRQFLPGSQE